MRIIAGRWRGRKLPVPSAPGLRPTPDRLRETLFNWLAPHLPGARCLDLFAGSGALGLEAASREAAEVWLVEKHPGLAGQLREQLIRLGAGQVHVREADALKFLEHPPEQPFDLVFLDPPFARNWLEPCCRRLDSGGWLHPDSRIYLEMERDLARRGGPPLPATWQCSRQSQAGETAGWLLEIGK